jgi:LPS sulfotransferase NodH
MPAQDHPAHGAATGPPEEPVTEPQPPQRFVILSCPRTGSTHLVDYLNAVERVRCLSEVFNERMVLLRHHHPADPRLNDMGLRNADPRGFLDRLEQEIGDCGWFGFKLFPNQNLPLLQQLCADRRWRKIFLWRDNQAEQYLSFLLASSHFGRKEWGRVPDQLKFKAWAGEFITDLHTIEANYQAIEKALVRADLDDVFALEYEELGDGATMRALMRFLGLPAASIEAAVAKAAADPALAFAPGPNSAARLQNYDEIRRILERSRYKRWIRR